MLAFETNSTFHRLQDATPEQWEIISSRCIPIQEKLPPRVYLMLETLDDDGDSGYAVSRLAHCCQTATKAVRDGRSDGYVAMCLLHDVGLGIAPRNHSEVAAGMLRPYLSDRLVWIVKHHSIFDFRYYGEYTGKDPNARNEYSDHEYYADAEEFCEVFDQSSFDPGYEAMTLEDFQPLLADVFAAGFGRPKID